MTKSREISDILTGVDIEGTITATGSISSTPQGTLWGSSNDGSGSGLDADTVDGVQADKIPYALNGSFGSTNTNTADGGIGANSIARSMFYRDNGSNFGTIGFHAQHASNGDYAWQMASTSYTDASSIQARVKNNGTWTSPVTIWNSGNDGSGSGLDADTVDGINASSFLRSDTADTASGKITMSTGIARSAANIGHLEGSYNNVGANSTNSNPIYTIGSSYNPASTTLGNMYGIGYCSTNASFIGFAGTSGWGMYVAADGDARVYLSGQSGSGHFTGNITAYASDKRLKTNVTTIDNALDKVCELRGVEYDWVDNITSEYDFHPSAMHETGVIAQEVQKVIPDAVVEAPMNANYTAKSGKNHEFLTVDKEKIIPILIEAIKELKAEVEQLKSEK